MYDIYIIQKSITNARMVVSNLEQHRQRSSEFLRLILENIVECPRVKRKHQIM